MELIDRLRFFAEGRNYLVNRAKTIDPNKVNTRGSNANLYVGSVSGMAALVGRQVAQNFAELTLDGAFGDALDRLGLEKTNGELPRLGAATAVVSLLMVRPTNTAGPGALQVGSVVLSAGIQYVTTQTATFTNTGLSSDLSQTVTAQAAHAGKSQQVGANTLTSFQSPPFDPTIQVTNPSAAAGGEDREDDQAYKSRIRAYPKTQRRGTKTAIELGAKSVPGIATASATEAINGDQSPARVVSLSVADSSGIANAVLGAQVQPALDDFRAFGIAVVISLGLPQLVAIALKLRFQASVNSGVLSTLVVGAVLGYVNSLGIGDTLSLAELKSVLVRYKSQGLIVRDDAIASPVGDLVPDPGKTIRTRPELISTV